MNIKFLKIYDIDPYINACLSPLTNPHSMYSLKELFKFNELIIFTSLPLNYPDNLMLMFFDKKTKKHVNEYMYRWHRIDNDKYNFLYESRTFFIQYKLCPIDQFIDL